MAVSNQLQPSFIFTSSWGNDPIFTSTGWIKPPSSMGVVAGKVTTTNDIDGRTMQLGGAKTAAGYFFFETTGI